MRHTNRPLASTVARKFSIHHRTMQLTVVLLVAVSGYATLSLTHAMTPVPSIEAENGKVNSSASVISDTSASHDKAVKFGGSSSPTKTTPPPTPPTAGCTTGSVAAPCMNGSASGTGAGGWGTPVFDDEFSGTVVDTAKWDPTCPDFSGGGLNGSATPASNTEVSGGDLILTQKSKGQGACVETSDSAGFNATNGRFSGTDFIEARISFPGSGSTLYNWPAWWTVGNSKDPTTGDETDISEVINGKMTWNYNCDHTLDSSICPYPGDGLGQRGSTLYSKQDSKSTCANDYGDTFHIYGIDREQGVTTVYCDGVAIGSTKTVDKNNPVWLLLNIGDDSQSQVGDTANYTTYNTVKVDYVRVWKK